MNDQRKLLMECITFNAEPRMLQESTTHPNQPFRVQGILQRKSKKNQNGRIYPDEILIREAQKYAQTFIADRRAMGELDHPECVSSCDIMTYEGWKDIKAVSVDELIATLNTVNGQLEYKPIQRIINDPYKGKMISIKGQNIDILVTPNHRFVLSTRTDRKSVEFIEKTAQEILEISRTTNNPHLSIPIVADGWLGKKYDTFVIPPVEISNRNLIEYKNTCSTPLVLNSKSWFSFLGFYLAEGHCSNRDNCKQYGIFITQKEGEISARFRTILDGLSSELEWHEYDKGNDSITFVTYDARLWTYLNKLGNKYTKYIPQEIKDSAMEHLQDLYDWFLNGDGSVVGDYGRTSIFSVSKKLMDDFYEVILKLGMTGVIKEQVSDRDYMFAGRLIDVKNKSPLYRLWIKKSKAVHLDFRFIKIEDVDFDDRVYCVTVENGTFYCRNGNKSFWSGNSSVVNLKNVSHNVVEMHWQGDDLIGTVEVLTTPNGNILRELFRNGIKLGISSRGLGTLKKISESSAVVGDDFELIAFDFVSNPSTQGAFMTMMGQVPLAEGVVHNPVTNRWEKTDDIIRNILSELG